PAVVPGRGRQTGPAPGGRMTGDTARARTGRGGPRNDLGSSGRWTRQDGGGDDAREWGEQYAGWTGGAQQGGAARVAGPGGAGRGDGAAAAAEPLPAAGERGGAAVRRTDPVRRGRG